MEGILRRFVTIGEMLVHPLEFKRILARRSDRSTVRRWTLGGVV
jgi:hypothetical protein